MTHPTLSPCPFCATAPIFEGAWTRHPTADCLMSDEVLFTWTVANQVRLWNQRAGMATK